MITTSPLSKKTDLSVYFKKPNTSLDRNKALSDIPIINGSSNLAPAIMPLSKIATKAKEPLITRQVFIIVSFTL
jgi:hypothetical protein